MTYITQMLPVPGSKVKHIHFRDKILEVLVVFGLYALREGASTINSSISRFYTSDANVLTVFRGSILWNTAVLEYCRVLYCGCCQVLTVFVR